MVQGAKTYATLILNLCTRTREELGIKRKDLDPLPPSRPSVLTGTDVALTARPQGEPMRVVIAMMKHETNTFSPVPTPLARFAQSGRRRTTDADVLAAYRGTGTALAPSSSSPSSRRRDRVADRRHAWPSGPVDDDAFEHIAERICDAVAARLRRRAARPARRDGHASRTKTAKASCCARIRAIAPDVPIGVALDMHTNLYDAMRSNAHGDRGLPDLSARRHATRPACAPAVPLLRACSQASARRRWPGAAGRCCRT